MRTITLLLMMALGVALAEAQYIKRGDWSASLQLQTGTRRHLSLGAGAQYVPVEKLRLDLNFNLYGDFNYDINLNAHYIFDVHRQKLYVYPLAGFCHACLDPSSDTPRVSRSGLNLGGGFEWRFDFDLSILLEARQTVMKDIHQTVVAAGARLTF